MAWELSDQELLSLQGERDRREQRKEGGREGGEEERKWRWNEFGNGKLLWNNSPLYHYKMF